MTCLFTHDDLDGVGCAIVARLAFPDDLVVRYCSYKSINSEINSFLDQLQEPVKIIISDISVNEETATRLDGYDVAMYDHHPITVRRPWMTIDISGGECGTSLLARALLGVFRLLKLNPPPPALVEDEQIWRADTGGGVHLLLKTLVTKFSKVRDELLLKVGLTHDVSILLLSCP